MTPRYKYCAVQLVGNLDNWGYAYYPSEKDYRSVGIAEESGWCELGHDDFIVAEFEGERCVAVHVGDMGRHTAESEDFGDYVTGINREFGILADDDDEAAEEAEEYDPTSCPDCGGEVVDDICIDCHWTPGDGDTP